MMKKSLFAVLALIIFGMYGCEKNHSPQIIDITYSPQSAIGNTVFTITAQVNDEDGDTLNFLWTADKGEFVGSVTSAVVQWKSPVLLSNESIAIILWVSDGTDAVSKTLKIMINKNNTPQIIDMAFSPETGGGNTIFTLTAQATDENNDVLSYLWTAEDGAFVDSATAAQVQWRAPVLLSDKEISIVLEVSDGIETVSDSIRIPITKTDTVLVDSRDGNVYRYIDIGTQTWMAENLAYLPSVNGVNDVSYTDPMYYIYDYDGNNVTDAKATDNYKKYGVLYNFPAATSDNNVNGKDICPAGWHLPTDDEWKTLEEYLGMSPAELDAYSWRDAGRVGVKLKSNTGWLTPGVDGDNSSGFSALPGGQRYTDDEYSGRFLYINEDGYFWTSSINNDSNAWYRFLNYFGAGVCRQNYLYSAGFSVRCVKD